MLYERENKFNFYGITAGLSTLLLPEMFSFKQFSHHLSQLFHLFIVITLEEQINLKSKLK